jgi:hypothetical protein
MEGTIPEDPRLTFEEDHWSPRLEDRPSIRFTPRRSCDEPSREHASGFLFGVRRIFQTRGLDTIFEGP